MEPLNNFTNNDNILSYFNFNNNPKIKFIINADDLGICSDRDLAIFELFNNNIVTSSSLLVNGINFLNSVNQAKLLNLPLGLHLNLTEGEPIYKNNLELNTLVYFDTYLNHYVMHGKFKFRELLLGNLINENDVKNEIIHQILKFIEHYNNIPSHIDGHQHIHIIPKIARILSTVMTNYFGVYQTRFPIENLKLIQNNVLNEIHNNFYLEIIKQTNESKIIYQNCGVYSTDYFIGMSLMGTNLNYENLDEAITTILEENKNKIKNNFPINNNISIELMCHPGYIPENFYWDDFNCSLDRIHEKQTIENIIPKLTKKYNLELSNFLNLQNNNRDNNKFNILIIGDFTFGTGNSITAIRLQKIIKNLNKNYSVYLQNIKFINNSDDNDNKNKLIKNLDNFINNKRIHFIIGIHLWRSGSVINELLYQNKLLKIPYILLCSGTDANTFINMEKESEVIKLSIDQSELIISFNQEMVDKIENKLGIINYKIIQQSVCLIKDLNNSNESTFCETDSTFSIRKKLNLNSNCKITLFPAGIRQIKDPKFVLKEILELLDENLDHFVILIGAVYDLKLKSEIDDIIKNYSRFILLDAIDHKDFINIIRESQLVINTSISEGMSNVLMESMQLGVPVIARVNEGNVKLIKNNFNGILFNDKEEFKDLFRKVYNDETFRNSLIFNAQLTISENFNLFSEIESYDKILQDVFDKFYKKLKINNNDKEDIFNLIFLNNVHPFSLENNLIFDKAFINIDNLDYNNFLNKKINLLDVGCGAGIFSFIFLLKNPHLKINELVLTDIEESCLSSSYLNFFYNKNYFNIDKITFIKSDLLLTLEDERKYYNYFDIVLANMPQTPSYKEIRSNFNINLNYNLFLEDKHGGVEGYNLYINLFKSLKNFICDHTLVYIL